MFTRYFIVFLLFIMVLFFVMKQVKPSYENQLLGDGFGAGEIFKQAAQELALYFSSP